MFDRIKTLLQRRADFKEVDAMSERDLADLGLSRDQLRDFVAMPHDLAERVTAMSRIFGVPEAELQRDHDRWVALLHSCGHCADRGACGLVLDRAELSGPRDAAFCPNGGAFAELSRQPGHAA